MMRSLEKRVPTWEHAVRTGATACGYLTLIEPRTINMTANKNLGSFLELGMMSRVHDIECNENTKATAWPTGAG